MKDFKEIAEKCIKGELSGRFKNRKGESIPSKELGRSYSKSYPYTYYYHCVNIYGNYIQERDLSGYDIIDFIPDNMQKKIEINIPEEMEAIQEIVDGEIRIKFVKKELTYADIISQLLIRKDISEPIYEFWSDKIHEGPSKSFYKKVEVLRKLTNIRNYFGKHNDGTAWFITRNLENKYICCQCLPQYSLNHTILFATKEHAQAAINMLGDELKYLFEPW